MAVLFDLSWHQLTVFTLVLGRLSGLVMTAPIFGTRDVPRRIRAMLCVALALMLTPSQWATPVPLPDAPLAFLAALVGEILLGLAWGLGILILFAGIQLAGQLVSQLSGVGLAELFNPEFDTSMPLFSQLLYLLTLAIFVVADGHRLVMDTLLSTFAAAPPGSVGIADSITTTVTELLTASFALGIRAVAPVWTAQLLATLVLGLISRTLPQLNVLLVGFGLSALVTLAALSVSLGEVAEAFQDEAQAVLTLLLDRLPADFNAAGGP